VTPVHPLRVNNGKNSNVENSLRKVFDMIRPLCLILEDGRTYFIDVEGSDGMAFGVN
jgi:hypothetical protein